eukprot:scaffold27384_cov36-Cyclotella_meneghiniana.AAC.8
MAAAYKAYNRNASSLEEAPQKPTYAETILLNRDFQFEVRGFMPEQIDLRAVSKVDVDRVVKEVDLEVLQELLSNITFGQITEDDFDLYSNDCFIKLFRISQLTIEQLLDSQTALCGHLNHLAKKYAEKKREIQSLSTNLSRQDVEVATLRDELHYLREERRLQQVSPKDVLEPSLYPSQEKRDDTETPPDEIVESNDCDISESPKQTDSETKDENVDGGVYDSPHQTDSETKDENIQLNIVVSSLGKCLTLNMHPSTTVEDLVEQLIMELLDYATEGATWELKFKGQILNDYLQMIQDADIDAENNGLVLEIIPRDTNKPGSNEIKATTEDDSKADVMCPNLNELVSTATVAHNELVEAARTLQHQTSFQDKVLESHLDLVRNEIRRGFSELALVQVGRQQDNNGDDEGLESRAQLNIGEIESDHDEETNTVPAVDSIINSEENEEKSQSRVELWIDTKAEYDGPLVSSEPLHYESRDSLESPVEPEECKKAVDEGGDVEEDGVFPLIDEYSLQNRSTNAPSGDRISTSSENAEDEDVASRNDILQPALVSMPTPPSLKKIHHSAEYFHFNGVESDDCVSVNILNTTYDSNNDLSKICGFEIKQGINEKDVMSDDMHSIEVSQSEFHDVVESTNDAPKDSDMNKRRDRMNIKPKAIKKMLPKWMKLKKKKKL